MRSIFYSARTFAFLSMLAISHYTYTAFDVHGFPKSPPGCRQYTQAFGPELNCDDALSGENDRKFDFIACSGSKLKQVYEDPGGDGSNKPSKSQANQLDGLNPDLTTISIGGNDIGFVDLLDKCVYHFQDFLCLGGDSANDSPDFATGYDKAIQSISEKAPKTYLFVTLYPRFFNADTDQCNDIQMNAGCSGEGGKILPLTKELREKMNTLTDNLNKAIKDAVGRNQPKDGGSAVYVNTNTLYEGHRFWEQGVNEPSYRNDQIWFYPFEFTTGGTVASISAYDNSTNCQDILDNGTGDQGDYFTCEIATSLADSKIKNNFPFANSGGDDVDPIKGADFEINSGSASLPDFLARIFHPTKAGHMAYKDAILTIYRDLSINGAGGSDPVCDATSTISSDAAIDIQKQWAGQKVESYEAVAGTQSCAAAGTASTDGRSQIEVCVKDGVTTGGKLDYGDMADALQKLIDDKDCNKDGKVGGSIAVGSDGMTIHIPLNPT